MVSFIALISGFWIAEFRNVSSSSLFHDSLAFVFGFCFSMSFLMSSFSVKEIQAMLLISMTFTVFCLSIFLFLPFLAPFIQPWYGGIRFSGWSKDPNQLALLLTTIPFFSIYLMNRHSSQIKKLWYILLIIATLIFGIATQTDSLKLSWTLGTFLIILLGTYRGIADYVNKYLTSIKAFVFKQITLFFILFITLGLGYLLLKEINSILTEVYSYGSQGEIRLKLWLNGIEAISHSPLFGLGPGSHSGLEAPLLDFEAHNTFIDWASSSGIVGLSCYIVLILWIGRKAWQRGSVPLITALIALITFSAFIYILRHIVFWFYLLDITVLCLPSISSKDVATCNICCQDRDLEAP
jgi:O-antigen ligase